MFDCHRVLQSKWSSWFGIPVSIPAVLAYCTILVGLSFVGSTKAAGVRRMAWTIVCFAALSAAAAAIWFLSIQFFVIKAACWQCCLCHICSLCLAGSGWYIANLPSPIRNIVVLVAFIGLLGLGGGQLIQGDENNIVVRAAPDHEDSAVGTVPDQLVVAGENTEEPTQPTVVRKPVVQPSPVTKEDDSKESSLVTPAVQFPEKRSRLVPFLRGGKVKVDTYTQPVLGNPDARYVFVKLFDYTCRQCKIIHGYLESVNRRYPNQIAVVVLPCPLSTQCNAYVSKTGKHHVNACQLARLAMVVWRTKPESFAEFHHWMLAYEDDTPRDIPETLDKVEKLLGRNPSKILASNSGLAPRIDKMISQYTKLYNLCGKGAIPKLIYEDKIIQGKNPSLDSFVELLVIRLGMELTSSPQPIDGI